MPNKEWEWKLNLEQHLYWVNAINSHKDKEQAKDLLGELIAISPKFHGEMVKFLRLIIKHSAENQGKRCHLNLDKTGFQACTCFRYEAVESESQEEMGFLVFVEEELTWYWSFSSEQMRGFLAVLEEASRVGET